MIFKSSKISIKNLDFIVGNLIINSKAIIFPNELGTNFTSFRHTMYHNNAKQLSSEEFINLLIQVKRTKNNVAKLNFINK